MKLQCIEKVDTHCNFLALELTDPLTNFRQSRVIREHMSSSVIVNIRHGGGRGYIA
jgi:hypothetical protein